MRKSYRAAVIGRTGHGNYGHGLDTVWIGMPDVELVAVADDDKAGLASAVKRLGVDQGFLDYREMLDRVKPDVVTIAQRWVDKHCEMAVACAERGIHMHMEKPLCATLAEADAMVEACERTHTKLALGHITAYSPLIGTVKQLIADGAIGRVLEYRARGTEDGRPITKADVVEGNEGLGPLAGDAIAATYGMPNDALATFASVRNAAGSKSAQSRFALQICGSGGIIELTSNYHPQVSILQDPSWSPQRGGGVWKPVTSQGIDKPETLGGDVQHAGGNLAVATDLLRAVEEDRQPVCSVYEARAAVEMIVAAFESQRMSRPVDLPLVTRVNPLTLLK